MTYCHCGHDYWDHFLDETWEGDVITGKCNEDDCNCTEFHNADDCELPHHEASACTEE